MGLSRLAQPIHGGVERVIDIHLAHRDLVQLAAMGTVHSQYCLPGCAETLRIGLDASRCFQIGFGADEEKRGHDGAPWLVQAGARPVSQPPTPGAVPLPVMLNHTLGGSGRLCETRPSAGICSRNQLQDMLAMGQLRPTRRKQHAHACPLRPERWGNRPASMWIAEN